VTLPLTTPSKVKSMVLFMSLFDSNNFCPKYFGATFKMGDTLYISLDMYLLTGRLGFSDDSDEFFIVENPSSALNDAALPM